MENQMPKEQGIDHSISLLNEGYEFIQSRSEKMGTNVFETRILGRKAICMIGEEAAQIFYDPARFQRNGAAPNRVKETLFGENSVQTLDDEEHRNRKAMLMSVMTADKLDELMELMKMQWEKSLDKWSKMDQIIFYEEIKELLCEVAFKWVGSPLNEKDVPKITKELAAMFESAASIGPTHWMGRIFRNNTEKMIHQLVVDMREGKIKFSPETILHQFAFHRDADGELLDPKIVAVEIINMLRPIVAISIYINFSLLALHQFPEQVEKLRSFDDYPKMFVQEVRRFYPFFPFVAAKVREDFTWNGNQFTKGTLTLLDLYGTNHDPAKWEDPHVFNPERFAYWKGTPFSFIPQGGGDYYLGHRCAGEQITIDAMKISLDFLVNRMEYKMPEQDLNYQLDDIPSIPNSKLILEQVKRSRSH